MSDAKGKNKNEKGRKKPKKHYFFLVFSLNFHFWVFIFQKSTPICIDWYTFSIIASLLRKSRYFEFFYKISAFCTFFSFPFVLFA